MKANDFEYSGKRLSDFDFIICNFSDKGLDTISNGAIVSFNTIPSLNGAHHRLVSTVYEECLTSTIQICKNPCKTNTMEISSATFRSLTGWLCQKKFQKFKLLDENNMDLYHEAIINVSRIEIDGKIVGLELEIETNRPFALKEPRTITIKNTVINGKHSINDTSYEEGYIYPYTEITIGNLDGIPESDRNLNIHNAIENRDTLIKNCVAGEVIIMDYPVIQSSISSHNKNIQNDFNWDFFRVANTYENSRNDLTISLPCTIKLKYSPIVKVGL